MLIIVVITWCVKRCDKKKSRNALYDEESDRPEKDAKVNVSPHSRSMTKMLDPDTFTLKKDSIDSLFPKFMHDTDSPLPMFVHVKL